MPLAPAGVRECGELLKFVLQRSPDEGKGWPRRGADAGPEQPWEAMDPLEEGPEVRARAPRPAVRSGCALGEVAQACRGPWAALQHLCSASQDLRVRRFGCPGAQELEL
jgi:hypothetical protein